MPNAVVRESNAVYVTPDGRRHVMNDIVVNADQAEQYRQGYRCLACHHAPQPEPFPEFCCEPYCRFPMREKQAERFNMEFRGEEDLWPTRADDLGIWTP